MRPHDYAVDDEADMKPRPHVNTTAFTLNITITRFCGIARCNMATAQKLYPRATLKKIVKAHSKKNLNKNVDPLVSDRACWYLETEMEANAKIDIP